MFCRVQLLLRIVRKEMDCLGKIRHLLITVIQLDLKILKGTTRITLKARENHCSHTVKSKVKAANKFSKLVQDKLMDLILKIV